MARMCDVCGKKPMFGNKISHANNVTKRRFDPNLKKVRVIDAGGAHRRAVVCTRCLRSGKVQKRVS